MDDDEMELQYMKRCTQASMLYIWPDKTETSWQSTSDIVAKLQAPCVVNEREQFAFEESEINKLNKTFTLK